MSEKSTISSKAESNVNETFDKIENSKIGKMMPKKLPEMSSTEIVKIMLLLKLLCMAPYYLIIKSSIGTTSDGFLAILGNFLKSLSTFIIFIDLAIAGLMYYLDFTILVMVLLITFCAKFITFIMCSMLNYLIEFNIICYFFYMLFICFFVGADLAFGYYINYRIRNSEDDYVTLDVKKEGENKDKEEEEKV